MVKYLKYCILSFIAASVVLWSGNVAFCHFRATDRYVRSRSVMLTGPGSCSGEQIEAPSGKMYILTAAHCKDLTGKKATMTVITEDGKKLERAIVAEDMDSDLLLLEGIPKLRGLEIAEKYERYQHVRTFTHGRGFPTYKTEGVMVGKRLVSIFLGAMGSDEYKGECKGKKFKILDIGTLFGTIKACVIQLDEAVTTAGVVPGSSGGMVIDDSGELIGVVSATDGNFGYLVLLSDIQAFIASY